MGKKICMISVVLFLLGFLSYNFAVRNVMYYGDWSIWEGEDEFFPNAIAGDQITHLNFAFMDFDAKGELVFTDPEAALVETVGLDGVEYGDPNAGILSGFQDLRARYPNLKLGLSVGGWSKSGDFSVVAGNAGLRRVLVSNLLKFIKYVNFDFVDIDWEYPNSWREPDLVDNARDEGTPNAGSADKANFLTLLKDIRAALDTQGAELNKTYELSVALSADPSGLNQGVDVVNVFNVIDFANMMTYDFYGSWSENSCHHTGLYTNRAGPDGTRGFSVDRIVTNLTGRGIPADKIVVGAAFYSRGWGKIANTGSTTTPGLFGSASAVYKDADGTSSLGGPNEAPLVSGDGGRVEGEWAYRSYATLKSKYGLTEYWDDVAKAPYMYNSTSGLFFSYDNVRSVDEKAKYVIKNNLGGIISWMASEDAPTGTGCRDELTRTIKKGLFGDEPLPEYKISPAPISAHINITTSGNGYELTLTNTATKEETQTVLALVETAGEIIKLPKLYIKTESGSTFSGGSSGIVVTNENGFGVVDLSGSARFINHGDSVTFRLEAIGTVSVSDITSVELSQRITTKGYEISRQSISVN